MRYCEITTRMAEITPERELEPCLDEISAIHARMLKIFCITREQLCYIEPSPAGRGIQLRRSRGRIEVFLEVLS